MRSMASGLSHVGQRLPRKPPFFPYSAQETPWSRSSPRDHFLRPVLPDPSGLVLLSQTGGGHWPPLLVWGLPHIHGSFPCLITPPLILVLPLCKVKGLSAWGWAEDEEWMGALALAQVPALPLPTVSVVAEPPDHSWQAGLRGWLLSSALRAGACCKLLLPALEPPGMLCSNRSWGKPGCGRLLTCLCWAPVTFPKPRRISWVHRCRLLSPL